MRPRACNEGISCLLILISRLPASINTLFMLCDLNILTTCYHYYCRHHPFLPLPKGPSEIPHETFSIIFPFFWLTQKLLSLDFVLIISCVQLCVWAKVSGISKLYLSIALSIIFILCSWDIIDLILSY